MTPRNTIKISDREELIFLLSEASELEHGLCCCYLFAFSLKRNLDEGLTPYRARRGYSMGTHDQRRGGSRDAHLALASNLLTALGASPRFRRPNFPQRSRYYPPSLQLTLRPFDEQTLDHFIFIERPEGMDFPDAPGFDTVAGLSARSSSDGIEPGEVPYSTVANSIETSNRASKP